MRSQSYRPRFLYALLVVPLLMGAQDGKGCCGKKAPEDTGPRDTGVQVENPVQVTSIDPSSAKPLTAFNATVFGAGFKSGATVKFNQLAVRDVTFKDENTLALAVPGLGEGSYDVTVTNPDGKSATLRRGVTVKSDMPDCSFVRVNFDFDQSVLTGDAKSTLDAKMPCVQSRQGKITIEGHADERGTTEYNLALGERRAETVKRYMTNQGVATSRVGTVSYGEEKPVAGGHEESAWAQNRRADIHVAE